MDAPKALREETGDVPSDENGGGCPFGGGKKDGGVYYGKYLQLDKLLDCQAPLSAAGGRTPAHEETLFIIIHQAYELWFKQILHEIDSIVSIFALDRVQEQQMGVIVNRLDRVCKIFNVLVEQFNVLETMYPIDFLEFRDFLVPASGFQSRQFRLLENKLGLSPSLRHQYQNTQYTTYFSEEDKAALLDSHDQLTLFTAVERWLERNPFLKSARFEFWSSYRQSVESILQRQREQVEQSAEDERDKARGLAEVEKNCSHFALLFDEQGYKDRFIDHSTSRHLSYKAVQAATLIHLYKDEPIFQMPFKLLQLLTDLDAQLTNWRIRHAAMVQRMIGAKLGTGGSSGYYYLRSTTTDRYKVFVDFSRISTYLIPRNSLPKLPRAMRKQMSFYERDGEEEEDEDSLPIFNSGRATPIPAAAAAAVAAAAAASPATSPAATAGGVCPHLAAVQ